MKSESARWPNKEEEKTAKCNAHDWIAAWDGDGCPRALSDLAQVREDEGEDDAAEEQQRGQPRHRDESKPAPEALATAWCRRIFQL